MSALRRSLLHVLLPLFAGGVIYLLFRSSTLLMFQWAAWLGILPWLEALRSAFRETAPALPSWVRFSLPTALYYLSVLNYCWLAWREHDIQVAWRWTAFVSLLAFGVEFAQAFVPSLGTFSLTDLLVYALVFPLSLPASLLLNRLIRGVPCAETSPT